MTAKIGASADNTKVTIGNAAAAGVAVGGFYHTVGAVKVRLV